MPNYCDSELLIKGNTVDIKHFEAFAKENDKLLSANKFVPYPEKFRKIDVFHQEEQIRQGVNFPVDKEGKWIKDGFNSGGYEWCCENWGTKWGMFDTVILNVTDTEILYKFSTAWSPPDPVIISMSKKYPNLTFYMKSWGETGFKCELECKAGKIIEEKYEEFNFYEDDGDDE